jgi:hypothetical protein
MHQHNTNPLEVSPREAWLEIQCQKLKAENDYLKQAQGHRYSMMEPPETLYVERYVNVLQLAAEVRMTNQNFNTPGLHVMARMYSEDPGTASLRYYVSDLEMLTTRDRSAIVVEMHRKLVMDIGRHLWDGK